MVTRTYMINENSNQIKFLNLMRKQKNKQLQNNNFWTQFRHGLAWHGVSKTPLKFGHIEYAKFNLII